MLGPSSADRQAHVSQVGPYKVVRELGRGGMATVYEAVHTGFGKRVALKLMHVAVRENPNAVERFFREARAAAQIRHHHVINVVDVGSDSGIPFIVMELVEGANLDEWKSSRGKLTVAETSALFLPIASAASCAHDAGIVHRDLTPSNVLVSEFPPR